MNLPPTTHADATALTDQLRLMGTAWWAMIEPAGLDEAAAMLAAAAVYMADYAGMVESRLIEQNDKVAALEESNQELSHTLRRAIELEQARAAHPSSQQPNLLPWQQKIVDEILAAFNRGQTPIINMPPQYGRSAVPEAVEWRGPSSAYFDNAEAINRAIAEEFFDGTIDGQEPPR